MKLIAIAFAVMICQMLGCRADEDALTAAYRKSVTWLWDQQSPDGGWHSETHAVLRDGVALTPYILYYLMQVPDSIFPKDEAVIEKGIEFVRSTAYAALDMPADSASSLNYPNYSAAYALKLMTLTKADSMLERMLVQHLLREQFVESRGIHPDNLAYGGWGYGEPDLPFGAHGHVDLSHTRRITEALLEIQPPDPLQRGSHDPATKINKLSTPVQGGRFVPSFIQQMSKSKTPPLKGVGGLLIVDLLQSSTNSQSLSSSVSTFLQSVQRSPADTRTYEGCTNRTKIPYDGGFVSSMATLYTNKCQPIEIDGAGLHYPSYATATCDGLLALHALGMQESQAYRDAVTWLTNHQRIEVIDGLSSDDPEQWYQVMHYYHWAVRAEAMTSVNIEGPWRRDLIHALIKEQQPDGYYINPIGGVNKEDDPLMATVFCIQACNALKSSR